MSAPSAPRLVKFGVFEFDLTTGDLFNGRRTIRLQEQPRQVLSILVNRPGELVTRDDLRALVWPGDTFVDFDTGLNVIVNKVRQALGDSAASPRFIETLPRRGYRFIAPVAQMSDGDVAAGESLTDPQRPDPDASRRADAAQPLAAAATRGWLRLSFLLTVVVIAAGLWLARGWRAAEPQASAGARIRTLAVLPLENLSNEAENDYFTDGMTDALITDLASIRSLNVIARQSTRQFKGSTKPVATIAKELGGVDAVIEGSVFRNGNRVRLIVQLIDARTERHLWARTYEQELTDILQLQRDAALTISSEIRATLTPQERSRLQHARQVNSAAHDAYLRGRYWLGKAAAEPNVSQALAEFQRAIDLDATYAPAYVGLAEAQQIRGTFPGGMPPLETRPAAVRAARRALEIDPDLGEAHGIMARLQFSEFDWIGADRSFARMLALAPGYAAGTIWYAYHLLSQGRSDDALEAIKRGEALDPLNLNIRVSVGLVHAFRREYRTAIDIYEQVLTLDPDNVNARLYLVTSAAQLGWNDKAIEEATTLVARLGRLPVTIGRLAYAHGRAGDRAAAERLIAELLDMARRQYVSPGHLAFAYVALGDRTRAFEWFERAYDERSNMMMLYPVEPMFEWPDDQRYVRLVAKIRQPHSVRDGS
jgi:TolB-like protein/DNA-binding winged helix-turn-helix (wHTH) protein/Tfp pilus assembly protein PilF